MTPASAAPHFAPDPAIDAARNEALAVRSKAQAFFATLAAEMRRPHFGDLQRDTYRAFLLRAQEAGLYDPTASFL